MVSLPGSRPLFPGAWRLNFRLPTPKVSKFRAGPEAQRPRSSQSAGHPERSRGNGDGHARIYAVIYYTFPCYTVLHYTLPYRTLPYPALPCDAMAVLCCVVPCSAVSCYAMLCCCYTIPCCTILCLTRLYDTMRHDATGTRYDTIVYYMRPNTTILHCTILSHQAASQVFEDQAVPISASGYLRQRPSRYGESNA